MLWQEFNDFGWGRSPWRELDTLQNEMNRLFSSVADPFQAYPFPAVNIWADRGENMLAIAELPGITAQDVDISIQGNNLRLSGSRQQEELREHQECHRRERNCDSFARTIRLPFHVDEDKVEASFKNGILRITLPRSEETRPKKIAVKTA